MELSARRRSCSCGVRHGLPSDASPALPSSRADVFHHHCAGPTRLVIRLFLCPLASIHFPLGLLMSTSPALFRATGLTFAYPNMVASQSPVFDSVSFDGKQGE